jgi:GNAT superfamily N-acetyltransferase
MHAPPGGEHFEEIVISRAATAAFEQFYAIYDEALPAGERKPRAALEALTARRDYTILGVTRSREVVAFAIVFASSAAPVGLLEYMATTKALRNAGIGASLFRSALARVGERVMLVEVDSERERTARDLDIRIRRKNFYLRMGCTQVEGLDYIMPKVGEEPPPVMDLLFHPNGLNIAVTDEVLRLWLGVVYAEVYDRSRHDPDIERMLRGWAAAKKGVGSNAASGRED